MRFVAKHTSVPVPKVYCAFVHKGSTYLVMSKVKGKMACYVWMAKSHRAVKSKITQRASSDANRASLRTPTGWGTHQQLRRRAGDQLVLAHGDLSSLNIMVEADEVVGIVDWETAGWFPP